MIALAIGGVFFFLMVIGGAFIAYRVSQDPTARRIIGATAAIATLVQEAKNGPGTDAMRAIGCGEAVALDTDRMRELEMTISPDAGVKKFPARMSLICEPSAIAKNPPTCAQVVAAYHAAVPSTGTISIRLAISGQTAPTCFQLYDEQGNFVSELKGK
jgi:hypothetical protein